MRCHYEVLGIDQAATSEEIKKAFRLSALKWHPDKHHNNNITIEDATERFQEIQAAHEVLSDPHERKWYDDHRDQILREADGENGDNENSDHDEINLFQYFRSSAYTGFGDDAKGFYAVFTTAFNKIYSIENDESSQSIFEFGGSKTPISDVLAFYQYWEHFASQRSFSWKDQYKTTDAPTRQIRRAMEKENKKLRDAAKKEFTNNVRELVDYVKKRDPRVATYKRDQEKRRKQMEEEHLAKKLEKQAKYKEERAAFQAQQEELWESTNTSQLAESLIQEELDRLEKQSNKEVYICDLCRKVFKSVKQYKAHLDSKKHKEVQQQAGISENDTWLDYIEDALDKDIEEELAARKCKQSGNINSDLCNLGLDDMDHIEIDEKEIKRKEKGEKELENEDKDSTQLEKMEKERQRLEKEEKAAEKRKERKIKRKEQKKDQVAKIVATAKKKAIDSDEEDGRKRGKKGNTKGRKK